MSYFAPADVTLTAKAVFSFVDDSVGINYAGKVSLERTIRLGAGSDINWLSMVEITSGGNAYVIRFDLGTGAITYVATDTSTKATVTLDPTGSNNSITFTAVNGGTAGNSLSVTIATPVATYDTKVKVAESTDIVIVPATKAHIVISGTTGGANSTVTYSRMEEGYPAWYSSNGDIVIRHFGANWEVKKLSGGYHATKASTAATPEALTTWTIVSGSGQPTLTIGTTTAQHVIDRVNADPKASSLVLATASGTVTGAVAAVAETSLASGTSGAVKASTGTITVSPASSSWKCEAVTAGFEGNLLELSIVAPAAENSTLQATVVNEGDEKVITISLETDSGVRQEKRVLSSTPSGGAAGTITVTVTDDYMPNSPKSFDVDIPASATLATIAALVAGGCAADADVGPEFNPSAVGDYMHLTRRYATGNSASFNIHYAGLTGATVSNVANGVAPVSVSTLTEVANAVNNTSTTAALVLMTVNSGGTNIVLGGGFNLTGGKSPFVINTTRGLNPNGIASDELLTKIKVFAMDIEALDDQHEENVTIAATSGDVPIPEFAIKASRNGAGVPYENAVLLAHNMEMMDTPGLITITSDGLGNSTLRFLVAGNAGS